MSWFAGRVAASSGLPLLRAAAGSGSLPGAGRPCTGCLRMRRAGLRMPGL